MSPVSENVEVFDRDAMSHGGYGYTTNAPLSSQLATQRSTDLILQMANMHDRKILDMGCGDAFYTIRFWDSAKPRSIVAVDGAPGALKVAQTNKAERPIQLAVANAHALPFPDNSFDLVLVQSILHHDDDPQDMIREAFRLAPEIMIHEPNGLNLGLKVIEKVSKYHREHGEKSYTSWQLENWIKKAGGRVTAKKFAGFVPMFASDKVANITKKIEPVLEHTPVMSALGCAVVVIMGRRD